MPDRVAVEDVLLLARRADDAGQHDAADVLYLAAAKAFDLGYAPGEPRHGRYGDELTRSDRLRRGHLWATALLIDPR